MAELFYRWLMSRDLTGFNPRCFAMTAALHARAQATSGHLLQAAAFLQMVRRRGCHEIQPLEQSLPQNRQGEHRGLSLGAGDPSREVSRSLGRSLPKGKQQPLEHIPYKYPFECMRGSGQPQQALLMRRRQQQLLEHTCLAVLIVRRCRVPTRAALSRRVALGRAKRTRGILSSSPWSSSHRVIEAGGDSESIEDKSTNNG